MGEPGGPLRTAYHQPMATPGDLTPLWFDDVLVSPFTDVLDMPTGGHHHRGGPDWPDWDAQGGARHRRAGVPIDVRPVPAVADVAVPGPLAWGGPIDFHFGHQIADFSMRIASTLAVDPGATVAFAANQRWGWTSMVDVPTWCRDLHTWLGLPPERTTLIAHPMRVGRLLVLPQAEQHKGPGPDAAHLDRMDALVERRIGRRPGGGGLLFVSRAGMHARFAGEAYLEQVLLDCGARVLRPETQPLRTQLEAYAAADVLLFSEGSAVHGLQLLGRGLGDLVILRRIPEKRTAEPSLAPRGRSLSYRDALVDVICGLLEPDEPFTVLGLPVLDPERIPEALGDVVPGLRRRWDARAYRSACEADVIAWFERSVPSERTRIPGSWSHMLATLDACGLRHLRPSVEPIVAAERQRLLSLGETPAD